MNIKPSYLQARCIKNMEKCYSKYADLTNPNAEFLYLKFHSDVISNTSFLVNDMINFGNTLKLPFLYEGAKAQKLVPIIWSNICSELKYEPEVAPIVVIRPTCKQYGRILFGAYEARRNCVYTFLDLPNLGRNGGLLEEFIHAVLAEKSGDGQRIRELYEKSGYKDFEDMMHEISSEIGRKKVLEKGNLVELSAKEFSEIQKEFKQRCIKRIMKKYGIERKVSEELVRAFNDGNINSFLKRNSKILRQLKIEQSMFYELYKLEEKTPEKEKWEEGIVNWHYDRIARKLIENPEYDLFYSTLTLSDVSSPITPRGEGIIAISKLEEKFGEESFSKELDNIEREPSEEQVKILESLYLS